MSEKTLPLDRRLARSGPGIRFRIGGGATTFVVVTIVLLVGPLLTPHSPLESLGGSFQAPGPQAFFGTDDVGRDVFSRVVYGARESWLSALLVVAVGVLVGLLVGSVAGLGPRVVDEILMRITDAFLSIPAVLIAIAVAAALGPSLQNALIAISVVWWPYYARIVRGEVRSLKTRPHVEAAIASGSGRLSLAMRHILPGALSSLVVAASLDLGYVVLTLSGLSFLGLGAAPPAPELGGMVAQGLPYLLTSWWVPIFPGIGVALIALVANLAGDALAAKTGGGR